MSDIQSERARSQSPPKAQTKAARRPIRRVSVACVACRDRKVKVRLRTGKSAHKLNVYSVMEILASETFHVRNVSKWIDLVYLT